MREWWSRRPAWKEYRAEARRLNTEISRKQAHLSANNTELAKTEQQLSWAREIQPQEIPVKIAKNETGLATIPGVALLEIRKREGKEVWTAVDHGSVYLTERQAIFSGSKNVKFRYDKIVDQELTAKHGCCTG